MAMKRPQNLVIEGATLIFKNFAGAAKGINPEGRRNFCVILDEETAKNMEVDGWNIKWPKVQNDEYDPNPYIQVSVRFDNYPPQIWMITGQGANKKKRLMDESEVAMLDRARLANVDIVVSPSIWSMNGKEGVKAYLDTMMVTLQAGAFDDKYADIPESTDAVDPLPFD